MRSYIRNRSALTNNNSKECRRWLPTWDRGIGRQGGSIEGRCSSLRCTPSRPRRPATRESIPRLPNSACRRQPWRCLMCNFTLDTQHITRSDGEAEYDLCKKIKMCGNSKIANIDQTRTGNGQGIQPDLNFIHSHIPSRPPLDDTGISSLPPRSVRAVRSRGRWVEVSRHSDSGWYALFGPPSCDTEILQELLLSVGLIMTENGTWKSCDPF